MSKGRNPPTITWRELLDEAKAAIRLMLGSALVETRESPAPSGEPEEILLVVKGFGAPGFLYNRVAVEFEDRHGVPVVMARGCDSWLGLNSIHFWDAVPGLIGEIYLLECQGKKIRVVVGHSLGAHYAMIMTLFFPKIRAVSVGAPYNLTTFPALNWIALRSLHLPPYFLALAVELRRELVRKGSDKRIYRCDYDYDPLVPHWAGRFPARNIFNLKGLPWEKPGSTHVYSILNPIVHEAIYHARQDSINEERETMKRQTPAKLRKKRLQVAA